MITGLYPALRSRLAAPGRRREISPAWRQAFVLASLVLFVLAAAAPSGARRGTGSPVAAGPVEGKEPCPLDGDLVEFVEGVGFAIGGCPEGHARQTPQKLSQHF